MVVYACVFGIHWLLKEGGDAALTEPVAVTTWLILYRFPVLRIGPLGYLGQLLSRRCLDRLAHLSITDSIGVRGAWDRPRGIGGQHVGRMVEGALDYASMDVGGGRWLAVNFPDSVLVLGAMLLATIWIRRLLS